MKNNTKDRTDQSNVCIAIVGRPNAGKSSVMNRLLGEKIAIVSDKPQTTRLRIMGVLTENNLQYVFIDTPGLHRPRTVLGEHMVQNIGDSMTDVDVCLLVADCTREISPAETELCASFKKKKLPAVLVLNKIDLVKKKDELLAVLLQYSRLYDFAAVVPVSAKTGDGMEALLPELVPFAQQGPHLFDDDTLTDQPERVIAAELIREKLLRLLEREVPHGIAVAIDKFSDRPDSGILDIEATIYCEKESHKGIIIGHGGETLKRAASQARADMEHFFDCKINLKCWVKVKEDWRNREGLIHNFGLD